MKKLMLKITSFLFTVILFLNTISCTAQAPHSRAHCENGDFDKKVASWLSFTVPTINPENVKKMPDALILDAREREEYAVSHLRNAVFIGYNKFEQETLQNVPKDKPIVVYCSIGYRSEKIGEKLQKLGFTKVYNLYGSIFEWMNQGNQVVDNQGVATKKVHTFNKNWSKWVDSKKADKIW